ncbi:23S rRNA (guanosine(2251)-2'-O)-methyltransferase RlmB [bacterium]|nr:23S rRNA (guanosine(2251)-2'-O)-methyltransferase RlmB [bacterium]
MFKKRELVYMYGKHALMEALISTPHVVKKVFLSPDLKDQELINLLRRNGISLAELKQGGGKASAKSLVGEDATHQGVIAVMHPNELTVDFDAFLANMKPDKHTALVLLDELTDPHNVGAIIRSAAAFGAAGALMPAHNQAGITGAVVKTSAGMIFRIPIIEIGNVNRAIQVLKDKGFWIYGLAAEGGSDIRAEKFDAPAVFIVGNEGKGIKEKTLEHCDIRLHIPIDERCESLNAAVSAAVALYQWRNSLK